MVPKPGDFLSFYFSKRFCKICILFEPVKNTKPLCVVNGNIYYKVYIYHGLTHVSRQGLLCTIRAGQNSAEHTISEERVAMRNQNRAEHIRNVCALLSQTKTEQSRAEQNKAEQSIHPWIMCSLPSRSRAEQTIHG